MGRRQEPAGDDAAALAREEAERGARHAAFEAYYAARAHDAA